MEKDRVVADDNLFWKCYSLCLNANWDNANFLILAKKEGLNPDSVKANAIRYMIEFLGMKQEDINKHFDFLISKNSARLLHRYSKLINYLVKTEVISSENVNDYFWISNNLEATILTSLHNICEAANWHDDLISQKSQEFGISSDVIVKKAKEYRKIFLKERDSKIEEHIRKKRNKRVYKKEEKRTLFDDLIDADDEKSIIKILSQIDSLDYEKKLKLLDELVSRPDYDKVDGLIKRKIEIYTQHQNRKLLNSKNDNNFVARAKKIIEEFIAYCGNVEDFCKEQEISLLAFGDYLALVKDNDLTLFNRYLEKEGMVGKRRH